MDRYELNL